MSDWRIRFEPAITPMLRLWWRLTRPVTLGVRALISDPEGGVMLVRHTYSAGWHLPGGGVEPLETALDAVKREAEEEAGVRAIATPVLHGFYANHANHPNDHVAVYRFTTWAPCAPTDNGEIAERGFFPLSALPAELKPGSRRRIHEAFDGAPISADW